MNLSTLKVMAADPALFERHLFREGLVIVGMDGDPLEKSVQAESVTAMASAMGDDVHDHLIMTPRQRAIATMAEGLGYIVAIHEGLDQMSGTDIDPLRSMLRHPKPDEEEPDPAAAPEGDPAADPAAAPDPNAPPPQ